jgi:aerobic carbon-monoxide dehydrogenase medium subunit
VKLDGRFRIPAPREEVFARLNDPQFFAYCLDGVSDLNEIDENNYTATLETRIAYINFRFSVSVVLLERIAPERVVARLEGTPLGTVGRLTSTAVANLVEAEGGRQTDIVYEMEVALTGKLGSLGQPVMKSKAKDMERGFVRKASAAFAPAPTAPAGMSAGVAAKSVPKPSVYRHFPGRIALWLAGLAESLAARLRGGRMGAAKVQHAELAASQASRRSSAPPPLRGGAVRTALAFELASPTSLTEAISLLDTEDRSVRPYSGGTALMLMMKSGVFKPSLLVDLSTLEDEMGGITADASGGLRIGALTTISELGRNADIRRAAPVLADAIPRLSNVRVRNAARVGGALAHGDPHMDLPPVLACLRAEVEIAGPSGNRRLAVEDLYSGYYQTVLGRGEIITAAHVPGQAGWRSVYRKMTVRTYDDWPAVGVAVSLSLNGRSIRDARVVISAATERVTRVGGVEALLIGATLDLGLCSRAGDLAAETVDAVDDVQGSAGYKKVLVGVEMRRALEAFLEEEAVREQA